MPTPPGGGPPPPPGGYGPDPDWFSKQAGWDGQDATKESDAALLDGTPGTYKWAEYMCDVPTTHCIFAADAATYLGAQKPDGIDHVLRVHYYADNSICGMVRQAMPTPAVGQCLFIRAIFYDPRDDNGYGGQPHPYQDTGNNWFFLMESPNTDPTGSGKGGPGLTPFCLENNNGGVPYERTRYYIFLPSHTVWYFVIRWRRISTSVWEPRVQVYSAVDAATRTPTYDSSDFCDRIGRLGQYAMDGANGIDNFAMPQAPHLEVGCNGTDATREWDYIFGAMAAKVSSNTEDWLVPLSLPERGYGTRAFFLDWAGQAVGAHSNAALMDGKCDAISGNDTTQDWLYIRAPTGRGFPADMARILEVHCPTVDTSRMLQIWQGHWSTPAIGGKRWFRIYHRSEFPNWGARGYHPMQNGLSNLAWEWKTGTVNNGHVTLQFWLNPTVGNYPWTHFDTGTVNGHPHTPDYNVNTTYRIEWMLERTSASVCRVEIRIYDEAVSMTVPVFTNDNFWNMNGDENLTQDEAQNTIDVNNVDACFQEFNLGNNGETALEDGYEYYGGYAVSEENWLGPYTAAAR